MINIETIQNIITFFGAPAIIVFGLSKWLGKSLLQNEKAKMNEDLERIKKLMDQDLERQKFEYQNSLERTKANLAVQVEMLKRRYNSINSERMDAIINNYKLLVEAWLLCRKAIQPSEVIGREKISNSDLFENAVNGIEIYFEDFERKKILLPKKTYEPIYDLLSAYWNSMTEFKQFYESNQPYEIKVKKLFKKWLINLEPQINTARNCIENEYIKILGINELENK